MTDADIYLAAAQSLFEEEQIDASAAISWVAYQLPAGKIMRLIRKFVDLFEDNFSTRKERILALLFMHQIHKLEA